MAMDELRGMMLDQLVFKSFNEYVGSLIWIGHMGADKMTVGTFKAHYSDRGSPLMNLIEMGLVAKELKRDPTPPMSGLECCYFTLTEKGRELEEGIKKELGPEEYERRIKGMYGV